jgi:hypothetical protein
MVEGGGDVLPEVKEGGVWEERKRGGKRGGGVGELERDVWNNHAEKVNAMSDDEDEEKNDDERKESESRDIHNHRTHDNSNRGKASHDDDEKTTTNASDASVTTPSHISNTRPLLNKDAIKPTTHHHKKHKSHQKRKSKSSKTKTKKSSSPQKTSKDVIIEGPRNVLLHEAVRKLLKFDFLPAEPRGRKKLIPDPRVPPPMPRYVQDLYERYQSGEMRHGPSLGNTVRSIPADIGE